MPDTPSPHPAAPAAVILAGGAGRRHGGVIKANLQFRGHRLLDHVEARLSGASPVLLSVGWHDPARFAPLGALVPLADARPDGGPLEGIRAAVTWLRAFRPDVERLVTLAVDAPFVPRDLVQRLQAALNDADAAHAVGAAEPETDLPGRAHPTHALYRIAALDSALAHLPDGAGPAALLTVLASRAVSFARVDGLDPFISINTPQILESLTEREP